MLENLVNGQAHYMNIDCGRRFALSMDCATCQHYKFCNKWYPGRRLMDIPVDKLEFYIFMEVKKDMIQLMDNLFIRGE